RSCDDARGGSLNEMFKSAFLKSTAPEPPPARSRLLSRSCCPPESRVLQNPRHVMDQSRALCGNNSGHELRNRTGLRKAMVVSPVAGRSVRCGSSGTDGAGICRRAGSGGVGIQDSGGGGWAAQLWFEASVKSVAVWIYDEEPQQPRAGAGMPGSDGNVMADGNEPSR